MCEKGAYKICGRFSHEEAIYYEVIGYTPGWGTRGRGQGSRGGCSGKPSHGGNKAASCGAFREVASTALHAEIVNNQVHALGQAQSLR